jgi:hypothetical protein
MKRELTNHLSAAPKMMSIDDTAMERQDIDKLLEVLIDGKWHTIEEIVQKTDIEEYRAKLVIAFLQQFQFIQIDEKTEKIKLSTSMRQFLEKLGDPNEASSFYEKMIA